MPLLVLLIAVAGTAALFALMLPLLLVQRYRMGKARRLARGWVAAVNVFSFALSALILLMMAAVASFWIPQAFVFVLGGLATGGILGIAGLLTSRWEATMRGLYYTPNRWLVLAIVVVVAARLGYGVWRGWQAWGSAPDAGSWLAAAGAAGSMGAGAVVIGYSLVYWAGLRRRVAAHARGGR
jgi:hypothetical protein